MRMNEKRTNQAEITYVKDTNCLMMTKNKELVSVKFYNHITEVPQTKEEQHFIKVLEKDAETMMREDHLNKATLDLQAFGKEKQVLNNDKEKSSLDKNNSNELEM